MPGAGTEVEDPLPGLRRRAPPRPAPSRGDCGHELAGADQRPSIASQDASP